MSYKLQENTTMLISQLEEIPEEHLLDFLDESQRVWRRNLALVVEFGLDLPLMVLRPEDLQETNDPKQVEWEA